MIKAIITDVDGVIVGKRRGVNFPLPNMAIITKLQELHKKGIPVVLNTAKFNFAVREIITRAGLQNPHITDGGALIIDPLAGKVIKKHVFKKSLAKEIVKTIITNGFYAEFYGIDDWFIQKNNIGEFTRKREAILQKKYKAVDSLLAVIDAIDVIKIFAFIHEPDDKNTVEKFLEPFSGQTHVVWSHHPLTLPTENAIITPKDVSKKTATEEVLGYLNISLENALGIGDTFGDWNFMQICNYAGVVGEGSRELVKLAHAKGKGKYFTAADVDHDGFIDIVNYFIK